MRGRKAAAWLLSVPLLAVGSQIAHVVAYRLVYPQAQVRLRDLLVTGHGYMVGQQGWLPVALGVLASAELVGIGWAFAGAVSRRPGRPLPASAFALLPLVGFSAQEFLERWLAGSTFPWWFVLQPTFRIGLALQLPFALVLYVLARALLRVVERVAETFVVAARPAGAGVARASWGVVESVAARSQLLVAGWLGRGPPAALGAVVV